MGDGEFSSLFRLYSDIHQTIGAIMTTAADEAAGIDPDQVVKDLIERYPDLQKSPSEIREAVIEFAAAAGVPIEPAPPVFAGRGSEHRRSQA